MASLSLGRDVANKRERKYTAAHMVAKSYPLYLAAVRMRRYGSLIKTNPSGKNKQVYLHRIGLETFSKVVCGGIKISYWF